MSHVPFSEGLHASLKSSALASRAVAAPFTDNKSGSYYEIIAPHYCC